MDDVKRVEAPGTNFMALASILHRWWQARWWIASVAALGALTGVGVIVFSKRIYRAEAVVMPVTMYQRSELANILGNLGGLASLAGLNVGDDSSARLGIATLQGKDFTASFIQEKGLMPALFADRWDGARNRWSGSPPTALEAVKRFDQIRHVIQDRKTGFVTIQIDWTDRAQAVEWLNSMVARVNRELRSAVISERQKSVGFLAAEADRTQSVGVKEAIYRVIESQMKELAFAQGREQFALKFVDRPIILESTDFVWPRRVFLVCLGTLLGSLLGAGGHLGLQALRSAQLGTHP